MKSLLRLAELFVPLGGIVWLLSAILNYFVIRELPPPQPELPDLLVEFAGKCASDNVAFVGELLQAGVSGESINGEGETAMASAARAGCGDTVLLLLEHGASVNTRSRGPTAMIVNIVLEPSCGGCMPYAPPCPVREAEDYGAAPLLFAVMEGRAQVVDIMLRAGADIRATNRAGATPLMLAALRGDTDIARRLIQAGADVNAETSRHQTALTCAKRRQRTDTVQLLLAAGATR